MIYENVEFQVKEFLGWTTVFSTDCDDHRIALELDSLEQQYPDRRVRAYSKGEGVLDLR